MPTFDHWRNRSHANVAGRRAAAAWERIQAKATSITVYRGTVAQTAQTVRLEWTVTAPDEQRGVAGQAVRARLVIFGVADHPDETVTDTNLARGDRFQVGGINYEVIDVLAYPGEVQAFAERIQ